MAKERKAFESEDNSGFSEAGTASGRRFYRKDGTANVVRKGIRFFDQLSWYHTMLAMPRLKFYLWLLIPYIFINLFFGLVYYLIGINHLMGIDKTNPMNEYIEAFFFSAQTFTTVGYGHVSPSGVLASAIASFEAFLGVLSFALASGLFYGRFSRPRSFLKFSNVCVIAPFKEGTAIMFRTVPYKNNHLMDAEVKLTLGLRVTKDGEQKNEFYPLKADISKINSLILNWTIVHPLDDESPLQGVSLEELKNMKGEIIVYIKAYDEAFSNTVIARTSYTGDEIIVGAKFVSMYTPSRTGAATTIYINRLNVYEKAELPQPRPDESE
jgi:inward rectifier potassium channel